MASSLGATLTDLTEGDDVRIEVGSSQYSGQVAEIDRARCELRAEVVEHGYVAMRLALDAETTNGREPPLQELHIRATEEVPLAWSTPTASVYDPSEEKPGEDLGAVTDVQPL